MYVKARIFNRFSRSRLIVLFWIGAATIVAFMACTGQFGWDAMVYWNAVQSVRHGFDPYAIDHVAQQAFHNQPCRQGHFPYGYVYSPMTLPLLRYFGMLPGWLLALMYGAAVAGGFILQLLAGLQLASESERRWLPLMLPWVAFFPGLLNEKTILCGNVVYIFYGLILVAAVQGWKHGRWLWYYLAVLAASVFKMPLLTLLAFPLLAGRRQWLPATITGAAGSLLFGIQAWLWPELFREYLLAVRLQFDWNHDFGVAPTGILGKALWDAGRPYLLATTILYPVFALSIGAVLLFLSHRFHRGEVSRRAWIPVALLGTLLLNPRIMEYDVAAFTVPMLLIAWRALRFALQYFSARDRDSLLCCTRSAHDRPDIAVILAGSGWFIAFNMISLATEWKPTESGILLGIFAMGVLVLRLSQPESDSVFHAPAHPHQERECFSV